MTTIREATADDTENILKWRNNPLVRANFVHQELLTAETHLKWRDENVKTGKVAQFIIVDTDRNRDIGSVYLRDIDRENLKAEFGIYIGEDDARQQGHGVRAARLILEYAFKELGLNRVFLRVFSTNLPAIKSYEKVGFVREGLFRSDVIIGGECIDMVFMAILREGYEG
jgi:UDP-4-amino-4,6-dideoxy-N-acetyl-beta-L-altrosamine N-acetyltransferase